MPSYVIDTNIVMGKLISGKSHYLKLVSFFEFHFPQYLLIELDEYKNVVQSKTKLDEQQLQKFTYAIFSQMRVVPSIVVSKSTLERARQLCENVDNKDISFVALSIETGFTLLTRDEVLYKGLRKQGYKNVILFEDFLTDLYKMN